MGTQRVGYLNNVSLGEALGHWRGELSKRGILDPLPAETIAVDESRGRVTAEPIFAKLSSPHCHCSAMDGYAVRFKETLEASEERPLRLVLGRDAIEINTGGPVPEGCNSVITIEDVDQVSAKEIEITEPVTPWQHIRTVGEDIVATELILPDNYVIDPAGVAALLAGGLVELPVRSQPIIAVIPTGSELVQPGSPGRAGTGETLLNGEKFTWLQDAGIIETNSRLLAGMASEWGALAMRGEIVEDDFAQIESAIREAACYSDAIIVSAGSAAGGTDYTVRAIEALGEILVRGVRIQPGKPVILGIIDNKPVLGVPGNPASAAMAMDLFAKPVIFGMQGLRTPAREKVEATIPRKITSSKSGDEFIRVQIGKQAGHLVAAPIERSSGAMISLAIADGILHIPENSEGFNPGTLAEIELLKRLDRLEDTIIAVGRHDMTLDVIASDLRKKNPQLTLASVNTGSMGGLMSLKRGEAHLAGIRLLDEDSGEYNMSQVKRYLPGRKISLVNIALTEKGLMVQKENPKNVRGIEDLTRNEVIFINRPRGTGTRTLLDYKLRLKGVSTEDIAGYEREEDSQMAVAAAIADGVADAGMGCPAAASALGLDFIPVASERYDLAIPEEYLENRGVRAIIEIIGSDAFREKILALDGYDTSLSGEVLGRC
ncbi:MAG: molybdopterin biosynthesis protein [Actinobacteria bacterium]|nr:molybdopterin biosynthesis protein [Actinomycetota bacterium]